MTADDPIRAVLYQVEQFRDHHCDCIGDWVCPVHNALGALLAVLDLCDEADAIENPSSSETSLIRTAIATALGIDT